MESLKPTTFSVMIFADTGICWGTPAGTIASQYCQ